MNPYQTEKYYIDYGFQLDPDAGDTTPHFNPRKSASLFELYQFTLNVTRIPYFIMWASAIALVRNYAKTMGRAKFLLITILPGLIFPIQIVESLVGIFPPLFASLYGSASLTLAGVFFGIIFFVSARAMKRTLGHDNAVSRYLTITGFGFILALTATSPAVHVIDRIHTPFPPFGALTWAFFGLAVYLVSSGFYLSAVSISQDVALRKSVRQVAAEESSKMLDTIGTAQMEQEIRRRVQKIAEEQEETLKEQTGIQQTISEEDVNTYVMNALEEVKKIHRKSD
ncbi:MAG: hypothetical protein MN733_44035 [Nitrososphaera sp.]|nr:hypothetical protein [Nitrososphaera sp.]